jgi:ComEC/Rec2-related protein
MNGIVAAMLPAAQIPERETLTPLHPWLPWLALGLVLGACAPSALHVAWGISWSPLLLWGTLGIFLLLAAFYLSRYFIWAARWLVFAHALLLGAALGDGWQTPAPFPEARLLAVAGTVQSVKWSGTTQGFSLTPTRVIMPENTVVSRRIFIRADHATGIKPGDDIIVRGLWQREERGDVIRATDIEFVAQREHSARGWAWDALSYLPHHRALGEALILGLGDPPEKDDFRKSGLLHILAVSGAHLAIAAALGAWLLRLFGLSWTWRTICLGVLIIGYTWITSAAPATQRALAMGLALVCAGLLAREPHRLSAVSLAALALIIFDPGNATDLGFQLSLVAVLGIVTLGVDLVQLRQNYFPLQPWPLDRPLWCAILWLTRTACDGLCLGFAACLAITPLIAWVFGTCNPWSPLTTLLATPPTTLALWAGLPYLVLHGLWPNGPWDGFVVLIDASLSALVYVVQLSAQLPGAQLTCGFPHALTMCAWPLLFLRVQEVRDAVVRLIAVVLFIYFF